jgi:hypothetical protein
MSVRNFKTKLYLSWEEYGTVDDFERVLRLWEEYTTELTNGTNNGTNVDTVWYDRVTAAAVQSYDLLGTLTSKLTGSVVNFVDVAGFAVRHRAAVGSTINLDIGQALATPWTGWLTGAGAATAAARLTGPGEIFWNCPGGGVAPGAGATDILAVTPSASTEWDILIWGRSA